MTAMTADTTEQNTSLKKTLFHATQALCKNDNRYNITKYQLFSKNPKLTKLAQ
jgi:hypothetical protein